MDPLTDEQAVPEWPSQEPETSGFHPKLSLQEAPAPLSSDAHFPGEETEAPCPPQAEVGDESLAGWVQWPFATSGAVLAAGGQGGRGAGPGAARSLEPEPGEERRRGAAGAWPGPPGFRKRRAPGHPRCAVPEVSVAWALGAGTRGGTAQTRSPRAPGDVAEAPQVLPGRGRCGTLLGALGPGIHHFPRVQFLSSVKWEPTWALGLQVLGREVPGAQDPS